MISERIFILKKDGTPTSRCFCRNPELIENYEAAISDTSQVWICHHRLETHNSDGERRLVDLTIEELIALNMYYDRPSEELIFLTKADHQNLHFKGKRHSEEHRAKISAANKGKRHSEESKRKMRENHKGMLNKHQSEDAKAKIANSRKGKHLSEETKTKLSALRKGKHWKLVDGKRVYY